MKRLPVIGIVLIVVGLGLILYSDPVVLLASGSTLGGQSFNATSTQGPGGNNSGNCQPTSNGGGVCGSPGGSGPLGSTSLITTITGIALCGAGIFVSAVDAISGSNVPREPAKVD